jgi:hypothetical protein
MRQSQRFSQIRGGSRGDFGGIAGFAEPIGLADVMVIGAVVFLAVEGISLPRDRDDVYCRYEVAT